MVSGGGLPEKSPEPSPPPPNMAPSRRCTETPGWNQVCSFNSRIRSRYHQERSCVVVAPGWMTRPESPSDRIERAIRTTPG